MRVLVTNDDGIDSPGLAVLANVAHAAGHEVVVAAPSHEYSGASASLIGHQSDGRLELTTGRPPGLAEGVRSFGVRAAPALIVFAASYSAFGDRPDLVLSGANLGANTGHATLHSGTVGAALSAATQGIPALAASVASADPQHWDTVTDVCRVALDWVVRHSPEGRVLNINVPDIPPDQLRGLRKARLAAFGAVQATVKERGEGWVHLAYEELDAKHEPDTDAYLLMHGWATSSLLRTPMHDVADPAPPEFTTDAADREEHEVAVSRGRTMSTGTG
ncbi:5'/3'-nucleotidase SurE [Ornithinimicrobium cryptoxanthini]|uniref:5'-nucleotidase n=1 Tax=Ornithinimicrobium cryptoxanthini TaxID=2934161 RepID=A0ABY4YEQ1_9MICO|nr:5'/3'-nucleotidase SurE [Ornithinimicrobium cryptoxanthini]USQ75218.1 5'/3'-nucleotidase SurE [Ornithinimicrobium cryptoxanthini]